MPLLTDDEGALIAAMDLRVAVETVRGKRIRGNRAAGCRNIRAADGQRAGKTGRTDGSNRCVGRAPSDSGSDIRCGTVTISAGGGELVSRAFADR